MHLYKRQIHFIGIGGAGMNALAEIMTHYGHRVTGSDMKKSTITDRLETLGIGIQYDHRPGLIEGADLVVYSSAVRPDNPERQYALEHKIACIRRAEMLGDLMRAKFSIGISGTHGKTTTTSLVGQALSHAGFDPTIIVGGTMRGRGANAVVGGGTVLVAEADEYDRSFLCMYPSIAVITNIEADHLDCYRDIADIRDSFCSYAARVPFYGALIVCADDSNAMEVSARLQKPVVTYGTAENAGYRAVDIEQGSGVSSFCVMRDGKKLGRIEIPLGGLHNVRNSCAAVAVCCEMGIGFDVICGGLKTFSGIRRRFEIIGRERGVTVVDDYAHHPSEIAATLSAARVSGFSRVIAVFQPHLYTRTRDFLGEFASSLAAADKVFVTGIYKAREDPIAGVSAAGIVERMNAAGFTQAAYIENKDSVINAVLSDAREGDGVVLMGAGDICEIGPRLIERLQNG
jgi:UDP-N-acetylmuramate--alanine ligase